MAEPHPPFTLITQKKGCEYKFYTEFQSHEPEFDYLKSLEIEEKINKIKWCRRQNAAHFLLSTNGAIPCSFLNFTPLLCSFIHPLAFALGSQTRPLNCGKYSKSRCE